MYKKFKKEQDDSAYWDRFDDRPNPYKPNPEGKLNSKSIDLNTARIMYIMDAESEARKKKAAAERIIEATTEKPVVEPVYVEIELPEFVELECIPYFFGYFFSNYFFLFVSQPAPLYARIIKILFFFIFVLFLFSWNEIKISENTKRQDLYRCLADSFIRKFFVVFIRYPLKKIFWKIFVHFLTIWFNKKGRKDRFAEWPIVIDLLASLCDVYVWDRTRDKNYIEHEEVPWKHGIYIGFWISDAYIFVDLYVKAGPAAAVEWIVFDYTYDVYTLVVESLRWRAYFYTCFYLWGPIWLLYFNYWSFLSLRNLFWLYFKDARYYSYELYLDFLYLINVVLFGAPKQSVKLKNVVKLKWLF